MSLGHGHPSIDAATIEAIASSTGTTTADEPVVRGDRCATADVRMFGDVDPAVRIRMELIARTSASADAALPHIIALMVAGDESKQAAIVEAITENEPLQEQWQRTWEILRR